MNSSARASSSPVVDAGADVLAQQRERRRDDLAGGGHQLDLGRRLADDHAAPLRDALERLDDLRPHLVARAVAVDADDDATRQVVADQRRRLAVEDLEPLGDRLRAVVRAALLLGPAA